MRKWAGPNECLCICDPRVRKGKVDVFAPILGLAEPEAESPWARFYGAGAEIDCRAWKKDLTSLRKIDKELWR